MNKYIIVAIIILIIILIGININYVHKQHLTGIYIGDPDFLADCGLSRFILTLEEPDYTNLGDGYIFVENDSGETLLNEAIQYRVWSFLAYCPIFRSAVRTSSITFYCDDLIFPNNLTYKLSVDGHLSLQDSDKVYMYALKNIE